MKNILAILLITLLSSNMVLADNCIGGKTIKGKNGTSYCISSTYMNWWSAFSWGQRHGGTLANLSEICDNSTNNEPWLGSSGKGVCNNIKGADCGYLWTANGYKTNLAYIAECNSGNVYTDINHYYYNGIRDRKNGAAICVGVN